MLKNKWYPDRKVWAGGLAGIISFLLMKFFDFNTDDAALYTTLIIATSQYFIPKSTWDKLKVINEDIRDKVSQESGV